MSAVASRPAARLVTPMRAAWLRIALFSVRRKRLSPLTWGLGLGLTTLMVVAIFPSIQGSAQFDELIESYPGALKEAFGISAASFATIEGYLSAEVFSLIAPFATSYFMIHAIAAGVSGGERSGMLDVLLSAPIRRSQLLIGWLAGCSAALMGIALVLAAITQASALVFGVDLAPEDTLAGALNLWPLGVFFGGVTVLLAGVWRRPGVVTGAAAGVLLVMYLVEVLGKLSDTMAAVDGLSAFHYYGSAIEDGLDPVACAVLVGAGAVLTAAGCALYERRDIVS